MANTIPLQDLDIGAGVDFQLPDLSTPAPATAQRPPQAGRTADAVVAQTRPSSADLVRFAQEEATRQGVDPAVIGRMISMESGGRADAVSPRGAFGPMQLMPATAADLARRHGGDPGNPYDNIRLGVRYLRENLDEFGGDYRKAVAAYQAGPGAVRRHGGPVPYGDGITSNQDYTNRIAGGSPGLDTVRRGASAADRGAGASAGFRRVEGGPLAYSTRRSGQQPGAYLPVDDLDLTEAMRQPEPPAEQRGQLDYLWDSAKMGWNSLVKGFRGNELATWGEMLTGFDAKYTPEQVEADPALQQRRTELVNGIEAKRAQIGELDAQSGALMQRARPGTREFFGIDQRDDLSTWQKIGEVGRIVAQNPGVVADLVVQSGPASIAMLSTALLTRFGFGGGMTPALVSAGNTSAMVEFGNDYAELRQKGAEHEDAFRDASIKSGIIGIFDAASLNAASTALRNVMGRSGVLARAGQAAGEVGRQAAYGMAGEAGGSLASGRTPEVAAVAAEGIGEIGSGIFEAGAFRARPPAQQRPGVAEPPPTDAQAPESPAPAGGDPGQPQRPSTVAQPAQEFDVLPAERLQIRPPQPRNRTIDASELVDALPRAPEDVQAGWNRIAGPAASDANPIEQIARLMYDRGAVSTLPEYQEFVAQAQAVAEQGGGIGQLRALAEQQIQRAEQTAPEITAILRDSRALRQQLFAPPPQLAAPVAQNLGQRFDAPVAESQAPALEAGDGGVAPTQAIAAPDRRAEARGPDRRQDAARRQRVADMTPDELRRELLTNDLTGIPNRRAYEEADRLPVQASIDADALKFVNDNMGHESGDKLLRAIAQSLADEGIEAYHVSGDEFLAQSVDEPSLRDALARARERLAGAVITVQMPDGEIREIKGPGFSFGIGPDQQVAETRLQENKAERERAGDRSARGQQPRGFSAQPAQRGKDSGREVAAQAQQGLVAAKQEPAAAEQKPASAKQRPLRKTAFDDPRLANPEIQGELRTMAREAGWAEIGGRVIRDEKGNVSGRTKWVPQAPWYGTMGDRLNRADTQAAVDKAIAGQPLSTKEKRALTNMLAIAEEHIANGRQAIDETPAAQPEPMEQFSTKDLEQSGYNELSDAGQALVDEAFDEQLDAAIDAAWNAAPNEKALSDEELDSIFGPAPEAQAMGRETAQPPAEAARGRDESRAPPARNEADEGFALSTQTPDELRAIDARARMAEEEQRKARERMAAPSADDFVLTGSSSTADEARARGQMELTEQPSLGLSAQAPERREPAKSAPAPGPVEAPQPVNRVEAAKPEADRAARIRDELDRLDKRYKKKANSFGPLVPPPVRASALDGIVRQMDKLSAELKALEQKPAEAETPARRPFKEEIAAMKAARDARRQAIRDAVVDGSVRLTSERLGPGLISPEPGREGRYRITRFDGDTPTGHTEYNSLEAAIDDASVQYEPDARAEDGGKGASQTIEDATLAASKKIVADLVDEFELKIGADGRSYYRTADDGSFVSIRPTTSGVVVAHNSRWKDSRGASNSVGSSDIYPDAAGARSSLVERLNWLEEKHGARRSIDAAAHDAATSPANDRPEPTEAQKEAGNYAKGHIRIAGLDISIENPAGTRRRPEWPVLPAHYGYVRSIRVKSQGPADASNNPAADAHLFGDSAEAQSIRSKGFDSLRVDRQKVVHGRMVSAFHDREILGAVIKSVPIDVVHGLVPSKPTTEQLLRDPSVFLNGFSGSLDNSVGAAAVARFIDTVATSHPPPLARLGAEKQAALGMSGTPPANGKNVAAGVTGNGSSHSAYYAPIAADGDHIDVFVNPGTAQDWNGQAFVIDQETKVGKFDEHKVMLGFASQTEAMRVYKSAYTPGAANYRGVTPMGIETFKRWLETADLTKRAASWEGPKEKATEPLTKALAKANKKAEPPGGFKAADAVSGQLERFKAFTSDLYDGNVTVEQFRSAYEAARDNESSIRADLSAMTKDELQRTFGLIFPGKKDEYVNAAYSSILRQFALNREYGPRGYFLLPGAEAQHKKDKAAALDELVKNTSAEDIAAYAQQIKANREERAAKRAEYAKAVENPETLQDFRRFIDYHTREGKTIQQARMLLSDEQRRQFDLMMAEESRANRKYTAEKRAEVRAAGQTVSGEIIETKHTQKGHDLFVVQLAERVGADDYKTLLAGAKKLDGYYSSFRGRGAVPGFQFRTRANAEAFRSLAMGDTTAAQAAASEQRDAFEDDRSQTAAQRLRTMADRLNEIATESLSRDRAQNTDRRARMAASAEAEARQQQALAQTMHNIAGAIEAGTAKFLDRVRQKVQVVMLGQMVTRGKNERLREQYPSYAEFEKHKDRAPEPADVEFVKFPTFTAYRSDLAKLGRQLSEIDGLKLVGQKIMKLADDVTEAFKKFAKEPANYFKLSTFSTQTGKRPTFGTADAAEAAIRRSGYRGKAIPFQIKRGEYTIIMSPSEAMERGVWQGDADTRITLDPDLGAEIVSKLTGSLYRKRVDVPYQFENAHADRQALARMGIETPAELRSALREFIGLREQPKAADRIKTMERAMIGRRADGLDFFPTSSATVDSMIESANIEQGMSVLEPSAGMGHIADRLRETGIEPDVAELSGDRRELLEAKGYPVVGTDFMQMTEAVRGFTYGDLMRAPDGKTGILRGLGGAGSDRVRLVDRENQEKVLGYYDFGQLEGVEKLGSNSGYDRILMNPPFSDGRDIQHVRHAYDLLKPGGRIVAIMGESAFTNQNKRAQEFRDWLDQVGGSQEKLPPGSFEDPSLPVNTSVNARMVVIDKPDGAQFSRGAGAGMGVDAARSAAGRITSGWANGPKVEIVATPGDLPFSAPGDAKGAFWRGKVYLVASNLSDEADLQFALFHEAIGHNGLRGSLGESLDAALTEIADRNPGIREAAAKWRRENPQGNLSEKGHRLLSIEEALADMAGRGTKPTLFRQFLATMQRALRRIGLHQVADWIEAHSDAEALELIADARRFVTGGKAHIYTPSMAAKWSRSDEPAAAPLWYSELARQIDGLSLKAAPAAQWKGTIAALKQKGVKADEIEWSGVSEWLDLQQGKVGKDAVLEFLRGNGVKVEETVLGGSVKMFKVIDRNGAFDQAFDNRAEAEAAAEEISGEVREGESDARHVGAATKFESYVLPGGKNYRELLLTLPERGKVVETKVSAPRGWGDTDGGNVGVERTGGENDFRSSHFDQPNILAHVRFNERADADGKRVLFIEEIQSDWAQKGKKEGIDIPGMGEEWAVYGGGRRHAEGLTKAQAESEAARLRAQNPSVFFSVEKTGFPRRGAVPNAPFIGKTEAWVGLALKRMIRYASENGFDRVAWTTGEQQAARYDLSKQIENVAWLKQPDGRYTITAFVRGGGRNIHKTDLTESDLADTIGKETAQKIVDGVGQESADKYGTRGMLRNTDLKVGGEGMRAFYDKIIQNVAKDLLRRLGGGQVTYISTNATPSGAQARYAAVRDGRSWRIRDIERQGSELYWIESGLTEEQARKRAAELNEEYLIQPGFDITPDMRERAAQGMPLFARRPQYWSSPADSRFDSIMYELQNKQVDLRRVTDAVRRFGGNIQDAWDAYLNEELYYGRAAKRVQDFAQAELRPLLRDMQDRGVSLDDFEAYLHNRHAEERNEQIARINPQMPDGGSGIDTAAARAYLAALTPEQRRNFAALAARVDAINAGTRQTLVAYGLQSQSDIDAWTNTYSKYVPLFREDLDGDGGGTGAGFSVRGEASRRAVGSRRGVVDILANVAMQRERAIVRGEKNRVAAALYGLARLNPNPDFWDVDRPRRVSYVDERTGLVATRLDQRYQGDQYVLARIPDGNGNIIERAVVFNERNERAMRSARALKNLDRDQLGFVLGNLAKVTRYFASINTQYNPIFGIVNLTRDFQGAMFNLSTTPIAGRKAQVTAHAARALIEIYRDLRSRRASGQTTNSPYAQLWEEFQNEGGQTGYMDAMHLSDERAQALASELRQLSEGRVKAGARAVFQWLSDYNTTMENAVRLGAYKTAIDAGISRPQAASLAKNLTVNFNRKGQMATQAGALYAFFNASVQGTARLAETLRGPAGRQIIAGGLILGVVQAMALAAAGFDDNEPPDFVRERNVIIPLGGGKYISIPMPLGFHIIPNISRIATEYALGGFRNGGKKLSQLIGSFAEAFNPIGNAGLSMQTLAPTAIDPIAALAENKDWTGKPIAKQDRSSLDPTPGFTRAKDTATWLAKRMAESLNTISGGTQYTPGVLSPTPDQIDYLVGQVTGGVGREISKAAQGASALISGEELPPHKRILVGRFYGDTASQSSAGGSFYENLRELNILENEIKGRAKDGKPIEPVLKAHPEAELIGMANGAERQLTQLNRAKQAAVAAGDKAQVKMVEQEITSVMRRLNEAVKAARSQAAKPAEQSAPPARSQADPTVRAMY